MPSTSPSKLSVENCNVDARSRNEPGHDDSTGGKIGAVATLFDVTDQRGLADQLEQAQIMAIIGSLVGGVAHEFNNLLTIILGANELLLTDLRLDDKCRERAIAIKEATEHAAELTKQLLSLSRGETVTPQVIDLNAIINAMRKLVRRLIGENIELTTVLDPQLHRITADPGQIEQVLMNLIVNARDAMPNGGKLIISTRNMEFNDHFDLFLQNQIEFQSGPRVILSVTDTGCGMDEVTKSRIFEPFFTTKEKGKGTGLGLSIVFGIVMQGRGYIDVCSEFGHGTSFKIYLPSA